MECPELVSIAQNKFVVADIHLYEHSGTVRGRWSGVCIRC